MEQALGVLDPEPENDLSFCFDVRVNALLFGKKIELEKLMRCPVDWGAETHTENWEWSILNLDWLHCLCKRMAESGDVPVLDIQYDALFDDVEDTYELDHLLINLRQRRPEAEELYFARSGRLSRLRFLSPGEHGKHFRPTLPKEQVAERSAGGPSLFWLNYASDLLRSAFWIWFQMYFDSVLAEEIDDFSVHPMIVYDRLNDSDNEPEDDLYHTPVGRLWQRFLKDTNLRICMNTLQPVGGCDGVLTSFLCYDIHIDAKTVHCYPVSQEEAVRIMDGEEVLLNDSLTC